jgi:hypothetical protein
MHRFLVFFWLVLGGALLTWHGIHPDDSRGRLMGSNLSLGWLALLLALYNGVRCWSQRSLPRTGFRQRRPRHPGAASAEQPPDPALDFGKESSGPEAGSRPTSG